VETAGNNSFRTGFLQGLALAAFLYAALFTAAILKNRGNESSVTLASEKIVIVRTQPAEAVLPLQPQPEDLHPEDHVSVPAPEATPVAEAPHPETAVPANDNKDLIEVTPQGPLPKRSPSGLTPFSAYKKSYSDPGKPVIAIAVLDYGLSENNSREALKKLPAEISFILSPYSQTPDVWKGLAGAEGHEFWVNVPLENQIYPAREDPGPQALLVHSDFKYNQEKFLWALSRTSGYAGIASYSDAAFLNAQSALKTLWDEGYTRGLGYFEINPAGLEGIEMNAVERTAPYVRNHAIFDEASQSTEQWLKTLELEASNTGYAIGVIRTPYLQILDAVAGWALTLDTRGFALAPVSALAQVKGDVPPAEQTAPAPAAAEETPHEPHH